MGNWGEGGKTDRQTETQTCTQRETETEIKTDREPELTHLFKNKPFDPPLSNLTAPQGSDLEVREGGRERQHSGVEGTLRSSKKE